jgi:3-methyladenine DNA glycosylase/8-oxoguanine DNA glycosylase
MVSGSTTVPSVSEDVVVALLERAGEAPLTRVWRSDRPIALRAQLGVFRRGSGDPTSRWGADGSVTRAAQTPEGVGTLHLVCRPAGSEVEALAWGPGAQWLLESVPALLGDADDADGFVPHHDPVAEAWRRFPHWRMSRSGLLFDALAPAVIEQKVTGQEAFSGYRTLVRRFGTVAPGPFPWLYAPPTAGGWAAIPSWAWLQASVDGGRSRTVVRAAGYAGRLEEGANLSVAEANRRMRALPGVGVWTAAEVSQRALGDADAVSFGDYHVAKDIGWALTGSPVDDAGLAELLEPYAGHRYRVQHLLGLAGHFRPRRGPRMPPRTHLPTHVR